MALNQAEMDAGKVVPESAGTPSSDSERAFCERRFLTGKTSQLLSEPFSSAADDAARVYFEDPDNAGHSLSVVPKTDDGRFFVVAADDGAGGFVVLYELQTLLDTLVAAGE